jgi:hypothetical protein
VPDPLEDLRARLSATQAAAERLAGEAAGAAGRAAGGGVPPQGWATPQDRTARQEEAQALVILLQALRDVVPPELQAQVSEVIRQVLLLLRAVIDFWVARLDPEGREAAAAAHPGQQRFEDIPIE